jgi:hypothetical protein
MSWLLIRFQAELIGTLEGSLFAPPDGSGFEGFGTVNSPRLMA